MWRLFRDIIFIGSVLAIIAKFFVQARILHDYAWLPYAIIIVLALLEQRTGERLQKENIDMI